MAEQEQKKMYNLSDIKHNSNRGGRKSLSAQEMAVLTRELGYDEAFNGEELGEERQDKVVELDDNTTASRAADKENVGFFGWIGRLFSSSVDIDFNGTHITGKIGYQVRGGAVPLFDGVVLDLTPAGMTAEKEGNDRQKIVPSGRIVGDAKLILSPRNNNFITENTIDHFEISAPKKGEVDNFNAQINHTVSYDIGEDKRLQAESANVDREQVRLTNPIIENDGQQQELESAYINNEGLTIQERSQPEVQVDNHQEIPQPEEESQEGNNEEINITSGDATVAANIQEKTFNITWGKFWSSDDEDEEETEGMDDEEKKSLKEQLNGFYKSIDEQFQKLKFGEEAIKTFIKTGELPENKFDTKEEKDKDNNPLEFSAEFPVLPGLSFKIVLGASYNFGFKMGLRMDKKDMPDKFEVTMKNKKPEIEYPSIERIIALGADLCGKFTTRLDLLLVAGFGFVAGLEGGLYAQGDLGGSANSKSGTGAEDVLVSGDVNIPVSIKNDGTINVDYNNLSLEFSGGIGLEGSVGGEIKFTSELFDFEKELYSCEFAKWQIAEFGIESTYKRNSEAPFFSTAGWKKEDSSSVFSLFGKQVMATDKYGLDMTAKDSIALEQKDAEDTLKKMQDLNEKIKAIKENAGVMSVDNKDNNQFIKELEKLSVSLKLLIESGNNRINEIDKEIKDYMDASGYKKSKEKADKGIVKHKDRISEMEKWKEGKGENIDESAYYYYAGLYGGKGAQKQKEIEDLLEAKKAVAKKTAIIEYERGRKKEVTKKHTKRIEALKTLIDNISEEDRAKPNAYFLTAYKNMGASELIKEAYKYTSVDKMMEYEQGRIDFYAQKHKTRAELLNQKAEELKISDKLDKPQKAFLEYYEKELNGKSFFCHGILMESHGDVDDLLNYEKNKLEKTDKKRMENITMLKSMLNSQQTYLNNSQNAESKKTKKDLLKNADEIEKATRKQYIENNGLKAIGSSIFERKSSRVKAATKQAIMDYEVDRYYESNKEKTTVENVEEQLRKLNESVDEKNYKAVRDMYNKNEKNKTMFDGWLKKRSNEDIIEMANLDDISMIEDRLAQEGYSFGKPTKESIYHRKNFNDIENKYAEILSNNGSSDAVKEHEKEEVRREFLKKLEVDKKTEAFCKEFRKSGFDVVTPERLKACFEEMIEKSGKKHKSRIEALCDFMNLQNIELPEERDKNFKIDTSKSNKTDIEVNDYYHSEAVGGGYGFDSYYSKLKGKEGFSIQEMLNYEEKMMMEESEQSILVLKKKEWEMKINGIIKGDDKKTTENNIAELKESATMGHYGRYVAIDNMKKLKKLPQEIFAKYRSMGGGDGYEDDLYKRRYEVIAPKELIDHESTWKGKDAQKHIKRLEKLNEWKENKNENVASDYHKMVLEDGTLVDKIISKIKNKTGFEKSLNPETVLTPQVIMEYEIERENELAQKHENRINELENANEEDILQKYYDLGGGKRFFRTNSEAVKEQQVKNNENIWGYEQIIKYEEERKKHYEELLANINKPLVDIEEVKKGIETQKNQLEEYQNMIDSDKMAEAFKNRGKFNEFTKATVGENAQGVTESIINTQEDATTTGHKAMEALKVLVDEMEKEPDMNEEEDLYDD